MLGSIALGLALSPVVMAHGDHHKIPDGKVISGDPLVRYLLELEAEADVFEATVANDFVWLIGYYAMDSHPADDSRVWPHLSNWHGFGRKCRQNTLYTRCF